MNFLRKNREKLYWSIDVYHSEYDSTNSSVLITHHACKCSSFLKKCMTIRCSWMHDHFRLIRLVVGLICDRYELCVYRSVSHLSLFLIKCKYTIDTTGDWHIKKSSSNRSVEKNCCWNYRNSQSFLIEFAKQKGGGSPFVAFFVLLLYFKNHPFTTWNNMHQFPMKRPAYSISG